MSEPIPPTSKSVNLTDEQIQRYDADSRIELIAECERLRAAVNEGAMGCCQLIKEDMTAEIERLTRERDRLTRLEKARDLWKERHDRERAAHAKNLTEQQKVETERDRLQAALVKHGAHAAGCSNQRNVGDCSCGLWAALSGEPAPKHAYYETHEPPHCPTCDCGSAHETESRLDEGKLWSFLRDVMATGCAIETDTRTLGRRYEEHSARLDAAARDAVPQFFQRLGLAEKAGERPRVQPPKFCAVDGCYNRVADDQEVCDSCSQNGTGESA